MARVVIIGAGLTGLSVAYHLEQQGFFDYVVLEKESEIGGLCRSITSNGFTYDYTGHLLHISDPYVKQLVDQLVGLSTFNYIQRSSFIYSHGTHTKYPFQVNLQGLPTAVIADCIQGFVKRRNIKDPKTFYSWVLKNFGAGFARHFFIPYQEKLFCCDARKFSAQWTGRFIPQTSLHDIIAGALGTNGASVGYNAHFYYPKSGGIAVLPQGFARSLRKPILTDHEVLAIDLKNRVVRCANGFEYQFDIVINTSALPIFLSRVHDTAATNFTSCCGNLRASSVLDINMGVTQSYVADKHWVYFPEHTYPFYRLGFYHNFSSALVPQDSNALYVECAYRGVCDQQMIDRSIKQVCSLYTLDPERIIDKTIVHIPHAYVLYNRWRDEHIKNLLARLQEVGIYSIGRYGSWKYASMQEAILDGKQCAVSVVSTQGEFWRKSVKKQQMARV